MNIDINKTISFIFSSIAIIMSIVSIIISKKNVKKQLRLNKLEEISEILYFLNGYYSSLFILFIDTENYVEIKSRGEEIPEYLTDLSEKRKRFSENINKETLINKISRLNVLSSAYLPSSKNLKYRIHSISSTYYHMYICIYNNGVILKNEENNIIPKRGQFERFHNKIQSDIVLEMNLGYQYIDRIAQKKYFNTQFLKELENE